MPPNASWILVATGHAADMEMAIHGLNHHALTNRVTVVRDGVEALDVLFGTGGHPGSPSHRLKMAFLDLGLSRVSGLEVLWRIRADGRTRFTPVIMVVPSQRARAFVEGTQLGVNSYLVRPVDCRQVSEAICDVGFYWLAALAARRRAVRSA